MRPCVVAERVIKWICLLALAAPVFAEPIPLGFKQEDEYKSQTQDTVVRVYRGKPYDWTGPIQIRVFRKENPKVDGFLLWEGQNRVWAIVSLDGESIAINNHVMSDTGLVDVFTRQVDGTYKKADVDFTDKALHWFDSQLHLKNAPGFDHLYCYATTWLTDHQVLGVLSGHMSGEHTLDGFWFIYDCKTGKFSFDLKAINQTAFHKVHHD